MEKSITEKYFSELHNILFNTSINSAYERKQEIKKLINRIHQDGYSEGYRDSQRDNEGYWTLRTDNLKFIKWKIILIKIYARRVNIIGQISLYH